MKQVLVQNVVILIGWNYVSEQNLPNLPDEIYCDIYCMWYSQKITVMYTLSYPHIKVVQW